ncbi:hypothetical protein WJX74_004359 [Apatococcus lobatus]|uniref:Uncharacterized protein n=1 Tax=Apatococcus lobatus TaxID=904363 RepID=A0AAW1SFZ2_9CHLO
MSSSTPDDHGLRNATDLPPELLPALRDTVERGEPLDKSQAFQKLTPVAQQEISGYLRDSKEAGVGGKSSLESPRRGRPEDPGKAAPSTSTPVPSSGSVDPPEARAAGGADTESRPSAQDQHEAGPAAPRQRPGAATAQARGPVFTEGSDGTSPYKPPPRAGQRTGNATQDARFQASQRMLQARLLLAAQPSHTGNPWALAEQQEPDQPLTRLPQPSEKQLSLQHQELIAKIAAAQHRMLVQGSMAGSQPFDPRGLLDPLPLGRNPQQDQSPRASPHQSLRGQPHHRVSKAPRRQMRHEAVHGSSSEDAPEMLADGDAEDEPTADQDAEDEVMADGDVEDVEDEPMGDGDVEPRKGVVDPREAKTAGVMDRMAKSTAAGPMHPEAALALLGEANTARGYQPAPDPRTSTARKVQRLVLHPGWLTSPVDILSLYEQLHRGDLDAPLPLLPSLQRIHQPITTRQLTSLNRDELAAVVAPSMASLHYCAAFSRDEHRQTGRNFAAMAVDATCMGIVLSEAMPGAFLQCLSLHLLDHSIKEHNPALAEIIGAANMAEQQQQQVEHLWRAFKENDDSLKEDFKTIKAKLNGVDLVCPFPLHDSNKTALLLELTSELTACLGLQLEGRVHLMRTLVLSILTPFQIGHMTSMSYPYIVAWPEIVQAVGEARVAAAAAAGPPSPPSVQSRNPVSGGALLPPRHMAPRSRVPRPRLQDTASTRVPHSAMPLLRDPAQPTSLPPPLRMSMPTPASEDDMLDTATWPGPSVPASDANPRRASPAANDAGSRQQMAAEPPGPRAPRDPLGSSDPTFETLNMQARDRKEAGDPFGATLRGNAAGHEIRSLQQQQQQQPQEDGPDHS